MEGVQPETYTATIEPGSTAELVISVTTGVTPVSRLDVVFLFDVTASMSWVSDTAKASAQEITQSISDLVEDSAFGVAYFADYPGYYSYPGYSSYYGANDELPFVLAQDVTTDHLLVSAAIDSLPDQFGEDWPESYTRAIYETMFMNWRSGAKKIVIIFGDAPTHDEDFYADLGENFGGDPGRDGIAGTADDLDFETVISQVHNEGITLMPIYCVSYSDELSQLSFDYMAAQTNGEVVNIDEAALIVPTIVSMVESQVETINILTLSVPAEYVDYVSWTPENYIDIGPEATVNFAVTITNPGDFIETESLSIPITALGDGVVLGTTATTIIMVASDMNIRVINLYEGWNLIGLPFAPEDPSIEVVLADILDDVTVVWAFDGETKIWLNYSPDAPSDLFEMVDDKGYWIKVNTDCILPLYE